MDRERHNNGDHYCFRHHQEVDRVCNGGMTTKSSSPSPDRATTPPLPPSCSSAGVGVGGGGGVSYIEHRVSKMDTLAGVAIKYGVEVADIKRINGLVTDLQMFALKSLHIPLPGRHPPSPNLSNDLDNQGSPCMDYDECFCRSSSSEQTPLRRRHSDFFDSFSSLKPRSAPQEKISPAMSNLRGYYRLKPTNPKTPPEGFEMAVYRDSGSHYLEDGPFSNHSKSKSFANGFLPENGRLAKDTAVSQVTEGIDSDILNEKLLRRRQKSETDFSFRTPEKLLKEDNDGGGFSFSAIIAKGLALRPKAAASRVDSEAGLSNPVPPLGSGDSLVGDSLNRVRKSSSTPSFQDQDNGSSSSSIWPTSRWSLKPDLQAFSTAAITKPIFDGFQNPMTGRKNKAALD
ncbi:hypothetical protein U1Q18_029820 [Sarracenia purpurea var. burkii]